MRVHIVGAAGYAAADLIRFLASHPHADLVTLESKSGAGQRVCDVFAALPHDTRVFEGEGAAHERLQRDDFVVLAGNRDTAKVLAPGYLAAGARVIDLSDAFRHAAPGNDAVYGFPERYRDAIAAARFVANPGCYPTASLLALLPLAPVAHQIGHIVIDAKSGITGAGRNPALGSMFAEVDADVHAYGTAGHRHQPEIFQELRAAGIDAPFVFSPHVVPLSRGMLADVYLVGTQPFDRDALRTLYERAYATSPFVQVLDGDRVPYLPALARTNFAQIAIAVRDGIAHIMSGIDNMGKGTAGNAVQNMNLMSGYPEETGLDARTLVV